MKRIWMQAVVAAVAVTGMGCTGEDSGGGGPSVLELPGDQFYPESIAIDAAGTLYVGSLVTGQVVKLTEDGDAIVHVESGGPIRGATGVLVDGASLWACDVDLSFASNSRVVQLDLATGTLIAAYDLAAFGFCNDLAFDGAGNLYVADSFGKVHRLPAGGSALSVWSGAAELAPTSADGFGADGIVWDGASGLYVNTFTDSRLFHIPILGNGSAGTLTEIEVTPALQFPDAMRMVSAATLAVVEGAGRLTEVTISGSTAVAVPLESGLDAPTSAVAQDGGWWVTEGQIPDFLSGTAPTLPFAVRRVEP